MSTSDQAPQGQRTISPVTLWAILLSALAVFVVAAVLILRHGTDERDRQLDALNDRYVEQIGFRGVTMSGSTRRFLTIDGGIRRDCSYEGDVITCDRDPQPTPE